MATVWGANWRVKLINYSSVSITMHKKWCTFRDYSMIMHEHQDTSQYQFQIVGQSAIFTLGDGLFWHCSGGVVEFEVNLDIFCTPLRKSLIYFEPPSLAIRQKWGKPRYIFNPPQRTLNIYWPPLTARPPPQCTVNKDQPLTAPETIRNNVNWTFLTD